MRIAITGGRGKLGRALSAVALTQGHQVVAIDARPPGGDDLRHPSLRHITADATAFDALKIAVTGSDALAHLAALTLPSGPTDHRVHNANVVSSYNALAAAAQVGIRQVCQASSVNAVGGVYSRRPRYDYFPLDEDHPTYNEDSYGLSKWICEAQADSMSRLNEEMAISSLRFHWLVHSRDEAITSPAGRTSTTRRDLWGYTTLEAGARAALAALTVEWTGHVVFYIVAPHTAADRPTNELCREFYPQVPLVQELPGSSGLYNCARAHLLLGWRHDIPHAQTS